MKILSILTGLAVGLVATCQAQSSVSVTVSVVNGSTTTYQSTLSPGAIAALNQLIAAIGAKQPQSIALAMPSVPLDIGDLLSQQISALVMQSAVAYQSKLTDAGVVAASAAMATANANALAASSTATTALKQAIAASAAVTTIKTSQ